jgi:hypothetical protein
LIATRIFFIPELCLGKGTDFGAKGLQFEEND